MYSGVFMQLDSIRFNQRIGSLPSGASLKSSGDIFVTESQHNLVFDELELGAGSYIWSNLGDIAINVDQQLDIAFNQVSMHINKESWIFTGFTVIFQGFYNLQLIKFN